MKQLDANLKEYMLGVQLATSSASMAFITDVYGNESLEEKERLVQNMEAAIATLGNLNEYSEEDKETVFDFMGAFVRRLCNLAQVYMTEKSYSKALPVLEKTIRLSSEGGQVLTGICYYQLEAARLGLLPEDQRKIDPEAMGKAYQNLRILETTPSSEIMSDISNMDYMYQGYYLLSVLYRLDNMAWRKDMQKVYQCLQQSLEFAGSNERKASIEADMASVQAEISRSGSGSSSGKSSGGCYIATCVYGSYDCPAVWTLRRFRDAYLLQSLPGRMFVKAYYAVSPTLVRWFGSYEWFRKPWKMFLDRFVDRLKRSGYPDDRYFD